MFANKITINDTDAHCCISYHEAPAKLLSTSTFGENQWDCAL